MSNPYLDRKWHRIRAGVSAGLVTVAALGLTIVVSEIKECAAERKAVDPLRTLIREGFAHAVPAEKPPDPDALKIFQWSPVVNGLACRVEFATEEWEAHGYKVFLRLENRGKIPLWVPVQNPEETESATTFELHARNGSSEWWREPWTMNENIGASRDASSTRATDTSDMKLDPGQSLLVRLSGWPFEKNYATEIKIVVRREPTGNKGLWHGVLESAPFPSMARKERFQSQADVLPLPDFLPRVIRWRYPDGFGMETDFDLARIPNNELFGCLALYRTAERRPYLEKLMVQEEDFTLKMLLAAESVKAGSERAAHFIRRGLSQTDLTNACSTHGALAVLLRHFKQETPQWLLELVLAALKDNRDATGEQVGSYQDGVTVSHLAEHRTGLISILGEVGCTEAIPFIIEIVKGSDCSREAIDALAEFDDPRSIPVLMECLIRATDSEDNTVIIDPNNFKYAVWALAQRKAKEAVPFLLQHVRQKEVVEALDRIGDVRAVPVLRELVDRGPSKKSISPSEIEGTDPSWVAAKIALASLEQDPKARTDRLCELFTDPTLGEFERRDVVWRLADEPDPSAIPHLIRLATTDPSGAVVNQSITVLKEFKHRDTIVGLIQCFDSSFEGKHDGKRAYNPEGFQATIAQSLRGITRKKIGPDKVAWAKWWESEGRHQEWAWEVKKTD